jgi:hypothetical protein
VQEVATELTGIAGIVTLIAIVYFLIVIAIWAWQQLVTIALHRAFAIGGAASIFYAPSIPVAWLVGVACLALAVLTSRA